MKNNQRLSDIRAMSTDQMNDELANLKKEQFTCASRRRRASSRTRVASGRFAATSPAS